MDEVVEVSQKLLTALESATQGKEFDEQVVGTYFDESQPYICHLFPALHVPFSAICSMTYV